MKYKFLITLVVSTAFAVKSYTQISDSSILNDIKNEITTTDLDSEKLVTNTGFNVFIQKRALNYLTGVSDLSLAKFYASYSTDNDKLNLDMSLYSL